ncbi:hypothetical protein BD413DRAFT_575758 [Trametes elegans]|nr:hypothetical protein BD413DRAFT_575758 [Trametes elegans]
MLASRPLSVGRAPGGACSPSLSDSAASRPAPQCSLFPAGLIGAQGTRNRRNGPFTPPPLPRPVRGLLTGPENVPNKPLAARHDPCRCVPRDRASASHRLVVRSLPALCLGARPPSVGGRPPRLLDLPPIDPPRARPTISPAPVCPSGGPRCGQRHMREVLRGA